MTMHAFNSTIQFVGPLDLLRGDGLVIGADGFVYGQGFLFTANSVGNHSIFIAGTAATASTALLLGSPTQHIQLCDVVVGATGLVRGFVGLSYIGSSLNLVNSGTIIGEQTAIDLSGGFTGNRIVNSGTILGSEAIYGLASRTADVTIINSGLIEGTFGSAIALNDAVVLGDFVVNTGLIIGSVVLGGGDDVFDNRGGRLSGAATGGSGNDWFRPGADGEFFDGGTGTDLLDFRAGGGAVEIALDGAWDATAWAEGDSYTGFENVIGTAFADRIGGDTGANVLKGAGGADSLYGQAGADALIGGGGADSLIGGAGNDSFRFDRLSECGDRILDFSSAAAGDNDRFLISAAGFGGGLVTGALAPAQFVSRADNQAQDANDRFIFRTTDRSLWFDADGTGSGSGILVATLQAGATMTAADFLII